MEAAVRLALEGTISRTRVILIASDAPPAIIVPTPHAATMHAPPATTALTYRRPTTHVQGYVFVAVIYYLIRS